MELSCKVCMDLQNLIAMNPIQSEFKFWRLVPLFHIQRVPQPSLLSIQNLSFTEKKNYSRKLILRTVLSNNNLSNVCHLGNCVKIDKAVNDPKIL